MKLGIMTGFDEGMIRFAKEVGFKSLELTFGPGDAVNASTVASGDAEKVRKTCDDLGMTISAIGWYANHLDPNLDERKKNAEYMAKMIDAAKALSVPVVCSFAGRDPEKSIEDNIPIFREVHSVTADYAEKKGIKIAFENCPMMDQHPFRSINMATTPAAWEMMFAAVPSKALGLEYDPSHLYWQEVDYIAAIYSFGNRIYHMHAKDTEVMEGQLARQGIYGHGWWRYRIPGWGSVDWGRVFAALFDVGYTGGVDIEHEDPVFHGERFKEGFVRGYNTLSRYFYELPRMEELPEAPPV